MRLHVKFFKLSLLVCLLLAFSPESNAQIDSTVITVNFTEYVDPVSSDSIDYMHTVVDVYPIDNFGFITISVFETHTGTPVSQLSMAKDELLAAGLLAGSTISFTAEYIDPEIDYTIETTVRTDRGAHSPKIIRYYEAP